MMNLTLRDLWTGFVLAALSVFAAAVGMFAVYGIAYLLIFLPATKWVAGVLLFLLIWRWFANG